MPLGRRALIACRRVVVVPSAFLLLCCILTLASVSACRSPDAIRHKHEYALAQGGGHDGAPARALLLPIDVLNERPVQGIDFANDRIASIIASHLESHGIRVERVDPIRFKRVADDARQAVARQRLADVGPTVPENRFGDLVPAILEDLGRSPDLVVTPNLVVRKGRYKGKRIIAWDGVKRREAVNSSHMRGVVPVVSIEIAVHDEDGTQRFSGFGGLEPLFRVDLSQTKYVQREDLFADERNLREGVCIALYPYFGTDEDCRSARLR